MPTKGTKLIVTLVGIVSCLLAATFVTEAVIQPVLNAVVTLVIAYVTGDVIAPWIGIFQKSKEEPKQ